MQFKLRYRPLQSQKQPAVGAAGIIDPVAIGDEAVAQAADIQERIPVGAVAREARHVNRQDQPTSLSPTRPTSSLKPPRCAADAPLRPRSASITSMSASCHPSSRARWRKRVLEPQAFLIAHHLMGCRLPDVDHGLARQVRRLDQFGPHETSPPEPRQCRRRSAAGEPGAAPPKDLSDPCSSDSRHSTADISSQSASILNLVQFAFSPSGSVADIGTNRLVPPRCSTSYEGGKLPPLCDERQMTRNDRP